MKKGLKITLLSIVLLFVGGRVNYNHTQINRSGTILLKAVDEDRVYTYEEDEEEPVAVDDIISEEEESALEEVKAWLSDHLDAQMVANIITWVSEAGVLAALLAIYIKYRKFKGKTIEDLVVLTKKEVGKHLKESFDGLSADSIASIIKSIDGLEHSVETIMKVLVLMQDSTRSGKVALLDFLGTKTNNQEIKDKAEEVMVDIEKETQKEEEVKDAVSGDYEKIF